MNSDELILGTNQKQTLSAKRNSTTSSRREEKSTYKKIHTRGSPKLGNSVDNDDLCSEKFRKKDSVADGVSCFTSSGISRFTVHPITIYGFRGSEHFHTSNKDNNHDDNDDDDDDYINDDNNGDDHNDYISNASRSPNHQICARFTQPQPAFR